MFTKVIVASVAVVVAHAEGHFAAHAVGHHGFAGAPHTAHSYGYAHATPVTKVTTMNGYNHATYDNAMHYAAAVPVAKVATTHGHAHAAPLIHAAPVTKVATAYGHAAPLSYAAAAPVAATYGHGAPLAYAAAAPVTKVAAAPVVAKAAVVYPPQPYEFGYESVDDYGNKQTRHEVADAHNNRKGSYSFTDAHGVSRHVEYTADKLGFRASIKTNEPGTASSAPAGALYNVAAKTKAVVAAPVVAKVTPGLAKVATAPVAAYAHAPAYKPGHY